MVLDMYKVAVSAVGHGTDGDLGDDVHGTAHGGPQTVDRRVRRCYEVVVVTSVAMHLVAEAHCTASEGGGGGGGGEVRVYRDVEDWVGTHYIGHHRSCAQRRQDAQNTDMKCNASSKEMVKDTPRYI